MDAGREGGSKDGGEVVVELLNSLQLPKKVGVRARARVACVRMVLACV